MYLLAIIAGYLIGSIPFGFLIARIKGIDIRKAGSGNIGFTNVLRVCGLVPGVLTLVLDILKGLLPVLLFRVGRERPGTGLESAYRTGLPSGYNSSSDVFFLHV